MSQDNKPGSNPLKNVNLDSAKHTLKKISNELAHSSFTKQLLAGTATGWFSGSCMVKLGKPLAFTSGAAIILLEIANHKGLIEANIHEKLESKKEAVASSVKEKSPATVTQIKNFAKKNKTFTAGFIGGILMGIAY